MTTEQSLAVCPYCGAALKKLPLRKTKCPSCNNFMYVRTLLTTREQVVVTEARAKEIEAEWETYHSQQKWLQTLEYYGIKQNDFEQEKVQLSKNFGKEASYRDAIWGLFNKLTVANSRDFQKLQALHHDMALFLDEEGRDFRSHLEEAAKYDLLYCRQHGIKKVRIDSFSDSCDACRKQTNKVYTVEEALRIMPVPCKECSSTFYSDHKGFCRCRYYYEI